MFESNYSRIEIANSGDTSQVIYMFESNYSRIEIGLQMVIPSEHTSV